MNISIVGEHYTGKSAFLHRLITGEFLEYTEFPYDVSLEFETCIGRKMMNFIECKKPLLASDAIFVFFDPEENVAFRQIEDIRNVFGKKIPICLIASKSDKGPLKFEIITKIVNFCNIHNVKFLHISSQTPHGIYDPIDYVLQKYWGVRVLLKNYIYA